MTTYIGEECTRCEALSLLVLIGRSCGEQRIVLHSVCMNDLFRERESHVRMEVPPYEAITYYKDHLNRLNIM